MWLGVALAIALCASLAVIFTVVGSQLSFKARETAEGVLSLVAVAGVTYMIVWMRRHSRELKGHLETARGARAHRRLGPRARVHGVLRRPP